MITKILKEKEGEVLISLEGRLDSLNAPKFNDAVHPLIGQEGMRMIIDCEKLIYICSAGLRSFVQLLKDTTTHNGSIALRGVNSEVRKVLDMTGLSWLFNESADETQP